MEIKLKYLCLWTDENPDSTQPIIIGCKDREVKDGERWVLTRLSKKRQKRFVSAFRSISNNRRMAVQQRLFSFLSSAGFTLSFMERSVIRCLIRNTLKH